MPTQRSILSALAAIMLTWPTAGLAGDAEVNSAQQTITSQLEAFKAEDGESAYGYAAPNVKRIFPSVERFMDMVRSGYPQVNAPKSYEMGRSLELSDREIVQEVLIVGPDNRSWKAIYTLQLQPNGNWQITGVSLKGDEGLAV